MIPHVLLLAFIGSGSVSVDDDRVPSVPVGAALAIQASLSLDSPSGRLREYCGDTLHRMYFLRVFASKPPIPSAEAWNEFKRSVLKEIGKDFEARLARHEYEACRDALVILRQVAPDDAVALLNRFNQGFSKCSFPMGDPNRPAKVAPTAVKGIVSFFNSEDYAFVSSRERYAVVTRRAFWNDSFSFDHNTLLSCNAIRNEGTKPLSTLIHMSNIVVGGGDFPDLNLTTALFDSNASANRWTSITHSYLFVNGDLTLPENSSMENSTVVVNGRLIVGKGVVLNKSRVYSTSPHLQQNDPFKAQKESEVVYEASETQFEQWVRFFTPARVGLQLNEQRVVRADGRSPLAGLQPGDRILSINGQTVKTAIEIKSHLRTAEYLSAATLRVQRGPAIVVESVNFSRGR